MNFRLWIFGNGCIFCSVGEPRSHEGIRQGRYKTNPHIFRQKKEKIDPYRRAVFLYDVLIEPLNAGLRAIGFNMYPPPSEALVLDVGCGTGTHLDIYRKAGCRVIGIDPSPAMLQEAKKKRRLGGVLCRAYGTFAPFQSAVFDLIIITLVLHEMPHRERRRLVEECRRLMRSDGRLLVIDYHSGPINRLGGWLMKGLITFIEFLAGTEHFRNYRHFLKTGGIQNILEGNHFSLLRHRIVGNGNLGIYLYEPSNLLFTGRAV